MATQEKQPKGHGLSSVFSCCCKESEQPAITYCHDSVNTVAVLEPTLPMPPPQELESMFIELVVRTKTQSTLSVSVYLLTPMVDQCPTPLSVFVLACIPG